MSTINGVICHHTASAAGSGECPSLNIVIHGRGEPNPLPGPLAQILLGRSGACYIIASGKANHAGTGSYPTIYPISGNTNLLGIEAENSGLGEPWTVPQVRSYVILCAALATQCRLTPAQVISHYEWAKPTGRKIDPAGPWLGGGNWYSGGQWTTASRTATALNFRTRVRMMMDSWKDDALTQAEHDMLVQASADAAYCKHILDDILRIKTDDIWTQVIDRNSPQLTVGAATMAIKTKVGA
jgi:hypothetical protein